MLIGIKIRIELYVYSNLVYARISPLIGLNPFKEDSMQNYSNELELVNSTSQGLAKHGDVHIGYITAELKPYSKQQKPDLEFKPSKSETILFLTFEMFDENMSNFQNLLSTVIDYKEFALDDELTKFIYATNIKIPKEWVDRFLEKGIVVLSNIKDDLSLTKKILFISGVTGN